MADEDRSLRDKLAERGITNVGDLVYALETAERSDTWVFLAYDIDEHGNMVPVNVAGPYSSEADAFAAGLQYEADFAAVAPDEERAHTMAVPMFGQSGQWLKPPT